MRGNSPSQSWGCPHIAVAPHDGQLAGDAGPGVVNKVLARMPTGSEDLEVLDAVTEIRCVRCSKTFYSKPGVKNKAGGRCACGGWICPVCLGCQSEDATKDKASSCVSQRKRFQKKAASENK